MANWVGKKEQSDPQGAQVAESTENERILTVTDGPSQPNPTTPGEAEFVVRTFDQTRPSSAITVLWIGGETKPSGMIDGDFWVRDSEEYTDPVIPDPDPTDPDPVDPEPVDPGTTTRHSVWGEGGIAPFPEPVLETDTQPIRLAAGFYTFSDQVIGWRAVGGKIYVPAGITIPGGNMFLYGPEVDGAPDLSAPIQTVPFQGITGPGWATADFTPVEMTPAQYYFVGYEVSNNSYLYSSNADTVEYISASDGSNVALMGQQESATAYRSWYKYADGQSTSAFGEVFYCMDIIVDEGAS